MVEYVFLDLDGVLADFIGAAAPLLGYDVTKWPAGEYSLELATGLPTAEIWRRIESNGRGAEFWRELPLLDGAKALVREAEALAGTVAVLSAPTELPSSYAGKRAWMQRHFPKLPLILCPSASKCWLAGPRRVLVDDSRQNCTDWGRAGGIPICYPQPWNPSSFRADRALGDVLAALRDTAADLAQQAVRNVAAAIAHSASETPAHG